MPRNLIKTRENPDDHMDAKKSSRRVVVTFDLFSSRKYGLRSTSSHKSILPYPEVPVIVAS